MSYILDALRKAEAERERGTIPGIHTQPSFAETPAMAAPPRSRLWIAVGALAVLLVLAASLAGYLLLGRGPANPAETMAAAVPANVSAPHLATTPATPSTNNPAAASPVSPASPVTTAATPAVLPAPRAPRPAPTARKAQPAAPPRVAAAPASVTTPTRDASSTAPPAPKAEERVYAVNELPDDIRRQLPALSVGGSMYSPKPADRLVIINGQVLHEGDRLTPELVLKQIKLKSAVFLFKNYRVTVAF